MLQVNTFYEVKISNNVNNCHINTNILLKYERYANVED